MFWKRALCVTWAHPLRKPIACWSSKRCCLINSMLRYDPTSNQVDFCTWTIVVHKGLSIFSTLFLGQDISGTISPDFCRGKRNSPMVLQRWSSILVLLVEVNIYICNVDHNRNSRSYIDSWPPFGFLLIILYPGLILGHSDSGSSEQP